MKKLSEFYPYILSIVGIIIATLLWDKLKFTYDTSNIIQGISFNKKINPYDNMLKVLFFIFFPLLLFFLAFLRNQDIYSVNPFKKDFFLKFDISNCKQDNQSNAKNLNNKFFVIVLFVLCLLEFFSLNFVYLLAPIDIYHDGQALVPAFNYLINKNFWLSIHYDFGFGGNLRPLLFWKLFDSETIGVARIFDQSLILFNKFCLILISFKTIELLKIKKNKEIFFLILALSSLQLSEYFISLHGTGGPPFPLRMSIFLLFFLFLIDNIDSKILIKNFTLGLFSSLSIFWYTDIAIYLNFVLITYLVILILLKNFNKIYQIIAGIIFSWICLIFYLGFEQINEIFFQINSNLAFIYYFNFIEFPKPFSDHYSSSRALKSLLIIIINGMLLINLCLKKSYKLTTNTKVYLILLFICSMVIFKSALIRSDAYHLKYTSGFILLLFIIQILYIFSNIQLIESFLKKINFNKFLINSIIVTIIVSSFVATKKIGVKSIKENFKTNLSKVITETDSNYLNFKPGMYSYGRVYSTKTLEDDKNFIEYYKNISKNDNCVQNFTEYLSLAYLLKKPTCTRYYNAQFIQHGTTDKRFLDEFKNNMPEYILYSSPVIFIDKNGVRQQDDLIKGVPKVEKFIKQNYTFHKSYLNQWSIYKKNSKM